MNKKLLTVGYADLANFGKFRETHGVENTLPILQEIFSQAGDYIFQNGGKIWKYLGDSILFSFESLEPAVKAANEIIRISRKEREFILKFFVGLATGEVVIAKFGHKSLLTEEIFGDPVNQATKLLKDPRIFTEGYLYFNKKK